jgi:hypothetical protein
MSKVKMRCVACGKWFQSANAKEVTCPDCAQKARKEKMAAKNVPPAANKPAGLAAGTGPVNPATVRPAAPPPKPKQEQGGTNQWLDRLDDVKVAQPEQPSRPKVPSVPAAPRENRGGPGGGRGPGGYREGGYRGPGGYREYEQRGPAPYRVGGGAGLPAAAGPRPRQPMEGGAPPGRNFRPDRQPHQGGPRPGAQGAPKPKPKARTPRVVTPPRPKKEKTPPPQPFVPTAEQVAQVEARYLELAVPAEFDGIRTQISKELSIPKKAVKKIVRDLRARQSIPSWWELQTYKGSAEEMEKIKAAYEPYLPLPPVGVHKQIAETLALKPTVVYQAIKTIRQEMNLPQYNDPSLHGLELRPRTQADGQHEQPAAEATAVQNTSEALESAPTEASAPVTQADAGSEPTVETASAPGNGGEAEQ